MADDHDEHDHGTLTFQRAEVDDPTLERLDRLHPPLAANLRAARRFETLSEEERAALPTLQRDVEAFPAWIPGYHSAGDRCATCGAAVTPVFRDRFEQGALPYGAFVAGLPVHATEACLGGFHDKRTNLSPRALDMARRELMQDHLRPTPHMAQFFRHDVLAHPAFGLEDWANSVADANGEGLDKQTRRDLERLLSWVHGRLFH